MSTDNTPQLLCWACGTSSGNEALPGSSYCASCLQALGAEGPASLSPETRRLLEQTLEDREPDEELWRLAKRAWAALLARIRVPPEQSDYQRAAAWAFAAAEALLSERQQRRAQG